METQWTEEEQKVLNTFLDGDRIVRLPAKQKKRLVVLRWLLDRMDPKEELPERELNARIARHHPDFAAIRREMVEFGFMERERGIYWRTPRLDQAPPDTARRGDALNLGSSTR